MDTACYGDSNNTAKKLTKGYYGDDSNIARKIKKGYYGDDNNIARLVFAVDKYLKSGLTYALSVARYNLAAGTIGDYALFTGGTSPSSVQTSIIDVFDTNFTRTNPIELTTATENHACANVGDFLVVAGGNEVLTAQAFDANLIKQSLSNLNEAGTGWYCPPAVAGVSIGNFALFRGLQKMTAYNENLVKSTPAALSAIRDCSVAASNSKYALFIGGKYNNSSLDANTNSDAYNENLTRTIINTVGASAQQGGAAGTDEYIFTAGGGTISSAFASVVAFNTNLTETTLEDMSVKRRYPMMVNVDGHIFMAGGAGGITAAVDVYDENLTKVILDDLCFPRYWGGAVAFGNQAIFAGGGNSSADVFSRAEIDIYEVLY